MQHRSLAPLALLVCLFFAACGGGGIAGTYEADEGKATLVLADGGTFTMDTAKKQHIEGTFTVDGSTITMTSSGPQGMTVKGTLDGGDIRVAFGPKETVYRKQ
jgi:hypothetical protein